jgi:hypothetical protein
MYPRLIILAGRRNNRFGLPLIGSIGNGNTSSREIGRAARADRTMPDAVRGENRLRQAADSEISAWRVRVPVIAVPGS